MHITNISEAKAPPPALIEKVISGELPSQHRDPFDTMLIAQVLLEGLTLVTRDSRFNRYKVPSIKA